MICEEAMVLMSAKLDAALSPAEEEALEAHLAACPDCAKLMQTLRGLDEQVAELGEPAPEGLKKGVLYRIDQATGKAKTPRRRWFGPGAALGAAAAVLVLLVGLNVIPLRNMAAHSAADEAPEMMCDTPVATRSAMEAPQEVAEGYEAAPGAAPNGMKGINYYAVSTDNSALDGEWQIVPEVSARHRSVTQAEETACSSLSKAENAAVLLYTEFTPESLFSLLEAEEPKLYELLSQLEPETRDGLVCYRTSCGTVLAIQEWLLTQLPRSDTPEDIPENALADRMEALDPGSASLYRIISWPAGKRSILWPESWPGDWADRMRTEENWRLFFPGENYVPNSEKTAYLVFPEQ